MRDRVEWEQELKRENEGLGGEKVHGILFTRKIHAENKYLRWELGSENEQMLAQLLCLETKKNGIAKNVCIVKKDFK